MDGCITILCPQCRRRLRVPVDRGDLVLTCRRCRTRWDYSPPRPEDVRYIDEDVVFIGEEVPAGDPGPQPSGGADGEEGPTRDGDGVSADLWDVDLDGLRPRERPGTVILPCPDCQRLLRVPTDRGELILTCPRCRTRWHWSPPEGHGPRSAQRWGRWMLRSFPRRIGARGEDAAMGFYSRLIFPRLHDWVMSDPRMAKLRSEVLADVGGEALEIGFGTGLNVAHYPKHIDRITTVDPNPGMSKMARKRIAESGIAVDQRASGAGGLPFEGGTFDCVVSTWTLCSIPEVGRSVRSTGSCGPAAG